MTKQPAGCGARLRDDRFVPGSTTKGAEIQSLGLEPKPTSPKLKLDTRIGLWHEKLYRASS